MNYEPGTQYTNGKRTILFRYPASGRMYYSEKGERKSVNRIDFYKWKLRKR